MKKLSILFLAFTVVLLIAGCVKDNSNTDFISLNQVTIKNIADTTTVGVEELFNIDPTITTSLNDASQLEYLWYAFGPTSQFAADTLSREKKLAVPVKMAPGEYTLVLKVTDKKTNVFYKSTTRLVVVNEFTPGIMVLGDNQGDAVLHFLNTSTGKFITDLYQNANGAEPLGRNPVSVSYYPKKSSMPSEVLVLCRDERGGVFADPISFIKMRTLRQSFFLPLEGNNALNVQRYVERSSGGLNDYIIINGKLYNRSTNSGELLFKPEMLGDYMLAPTEFYESSSRSGFYDDKNKRFIAHNNTAGALNPFITGTTGNIIDPNNVGLSILYSGCVSANNFFALFKDIAGTQRYILSMTMNGLALTFTAKEKYSINADNIQNATAYASSVALSNYLFYSAGGKIYVYNVISKSGGLLKDIGNEYVINFLKLNGSELKVGFVNSLAAGKKAGFATFNITTVGGLNAQETRRKEGICDKIVDLTDKI